MRQSTRNSTGILDREKASNLLIPKNRRTLFNEISELFFRMNDY